MTSPPPPAAARRVAVVGQGYVGLPVAHACVAAGHTVIGYDVDDVKTTAVNAGRSPIDDLTDTDLSLMLRTGRYTATTDLDRLAGCTVYLVTVPTPLRDGRPDLSAVTAAARTIGPHLRDGALVVLESTVAPGTTRGAFHAELLRRAPANARFLVAFSPERIDPGNPTWHFRNTPKLVGGIDVEATAAAVHFYATICETVVPCQTPEVAEMAKLLENTYRYVNIALVNELGRHAHDLGVSIWDVVAAASTKPYGFQPFWPGPGVGGHCLPVDPMYLSDRVEQQLGRPFALVDLADRINAGQPRYVVERAMHLLNDAGKAVNGSFVLVLGAAYKAGTADTRETPAEDIIARLRHLGAEVIVADPHLRGGTGGWADGFVKVVDHAEAAALAGDADLVVLVTDHDEFPYEAIAARARLILDTRHRFTPATHITRL